MTSRERRLKFMAGFGDRALLAAATAAMYRVGIEHWLTDEQLEEIVQQQIVDWKRAERMHRRNRKIVKERNTHRETKKQ